jgi:ATP-dependent DNA helicase RecG
MTRDGQTRALDTPVSRLFSAGTRRLQGLRRLGISTIRDLLFAYPFRYNDFSRIIPIANTPLGERSSVLGTVFEVKVKRPRPRLTVIEVSVIDDTALLIATWFNQPWMVKSLAKGTRVILQGKVEHNYGFRRMNSPLHTLLDADDATGGIMPVYRANADITQGWVARMIEEAFSLAPATLDPLPASLRIRLGLMSRHAALRCIHRPPDGERLRQARRRLAFEEVFLLQLLLLRRRQRLNAMSSPKTHRVDGPALRDLRERLPFTLTADQEQATGEILADLARPEVMNRLLLGDVGSGKTVVAALALAAVHDSGFQAAMMAPTEVLAEQYAAKLGPLFDSVGIPWALLTSSTKPSDRRQMLDALATGHLSALFGTHALIERDVVFRELSLAIIDEQHRFGVEQRRALRSKGEGSDLLAMTATPIPRSLALTIYGDREVSTLRTRPRADAKTTTKVINKAEIRIAYEGIREALRRGEQAYIVCPLISFPSTASDASKAAHRAGAERDDGADTGRDGGRDDGHDGAGDAGHGRGGRDGAGNAGGGSRTDASPEPEDERELITEFSGEQDEGHIQAAEQEVSFLRAKVFPQYRVGLMTSRLKSAEKRQVMDDFRAGRIDVLVSTTVIEVGIDVPNATVMVIEDADRFGLSQLHQLRGRVGRGERDGQVFLVSGTRDEDARKRLVAMERSSDGFALAEYDLKLRREGDVLGSRQHGAATLRLVNVIRDAELIQQAHTEARGLLAADPSLAAPEHQHLAVELQALFGADQKETEGV